jgi:Cft2 family RNA processing exonuclease
VASSEKKAMSNSTLHYLNFQQSGRLEIIENKVMFICHDGVMFPIKEHREEHPIYTNGLWQIIPVTMTDGRMIKYEIKEFIQEQTDDNLNVDNKCIATGIITLLTKKGCLEILIKGNGRKLKIHFNGKDSKMKMGHTWSLEAVRELDRLVIVKCEMQKIDFSINSQENISQNTTIQEEKQEEELIDLSQTLFDAFYVEQQDTDISVFQEDLPVDELEIPQDDFFEEVESLEEILEIEANQISTEQHDNIETIIEKQLCTQALFVATNIENWELSASNKYLGISQWSAESATGIKAKVKIAQDNSTSVFVFPNDNQTRTSIDKKYESRLEACVLGGEESISPICIKVNIGPYEVILDCGIKKEQYVSVKPKLIEPDTDYIQENTFPLPKLDLIKNPDLLLISHAHPENIGALPIFHSTWKKCRMISTSMTRSLASVVLETACIDSSEKSKELPLLFYKSELADSIFYLETKEQDSEFSPLPGLRVKFINAGHFPGNVSIWMQYGEVSLLYIGNFNTTSTCTVDGMNWEELSKVNMLIMPCTHADIKFPSRKKQESALIQEITNAINQDNIIFIPLSSLGKAQEIINFLKESVILKKLNIPIYVDGEAIQVTEVYQNNIKELSSGIASAFHHSANEPFFSNKTHVKVIPVTEKINRENILKEKCIIICSPCNISGATKFYLKNLLDNPKATVFLSCYQDEDISSEILHVLRNRKTVKIDEKSISIQANLQQYFLRIHGSIIEIVRLLKHIDPDLCILFNGDMKSIETVFNYKALKNTFMAKSGQIVSLSPKSLSSSGFPDEESIEVIEEFDIEIVAQGEHGALIYIPPNIINNNPRWKNLIESGNLIGKWRHNNILVTSNKKSISNQNFQSTDLILKRNIPKVCVNCIYYQANICTSNRSPLFATKVKTNDACPEFTQI